MKIYKIFFDKTPCGSPKYSVICIKFTLYTLFFYKQSGWNWQKLKQKLSNTLRLNFCSPKTIHILHPPYHPKTIRDILKNKQNNKCVCIHKIMGLIIKRHGLKYNKYKCLSRMMLICIKQHLSSIWSSIQKKIKQHWDWVEKSRCF